jgi:hypothetical protein
MPTGPADAGIVNVVASTTAAEIIKSVFIVLTSVWLRCDSTRKSCASNQIQFFVQRNHAALMELVRSIKAIGYSGRIKFDASRADRAAFAGEAARPNDM